MPSPFTAKRGGLFVQPGGPNTEPFYLGCHTLADITESEGAIELLRCFNPEGDGWDVAGNTISPPDPVTFSIETHMMKTRSWIQRMEFPASFYVLQSETGRRDNFKNYDSGMVIADARRSSKTRSGTVAIEEDAASMVSADFEAYPPVYELDEQTVTRQASVATDVLNDIWMNPDAHDYASWGSRLYRGSLGIAGGDSAVGPALATLLFVTEYGDTLTPAGADPMAAGVDLEATRFFYVGKNTRRYVVSMEAPAGAQGLTAYSDDGGAVWTTSNVGGAVAGHGTLNGRALWCPNERFSLLASNLGFIYKSTDGCVTWVAKEEAGIAATLYACVHADPTDTYCIAGGPADAIVLSEDGGESWQVSAAVTGGGGDILCCWRFDENKMFVGTDDGELWYSRDGGVSWTEQTRIPGIGVGDVMDMYWNNEHVGWIAKDTAAPVGAILRTINGGWDWEAITTPTNAGLNAIMAPTVNLCYAVGNLQGGTSFIARSKSVGIDLPTA